jgi:hypothetical protein
MLKALFSLQIALSLVFCGIIYYVAGKTESISFLSGALYASINLAFIVFIVSRLFRKKSVALTFILIIFKYTIFGVGLYYLVTSKLLMVSWFVVGLSILLPSILGLAISYWKQQEREK